MRYFLLIPKATILQLSSWMTFLANDFSGTMKLVPLNLETWEYSLGIFFVFIMNIKCSQIFFLISHYKEHILWNEDGRNLYMTSSLGLAYSQELLPNPKYCFYLCLLQLQADRLLKLFMENLQCKAWLNIAIILYSIYFIAGIWSDVLTDDFFFPFCSISSQWTSQRVSHCSGPFISKLQMHPSRSLFGILSF